MQIFGVTGEWLGRMGNTEAEQEREREREQAPEPEPEWKGILLAKPSVSVRKGIAWGTNPPSEPTSTLVLTSTKSYYVDIRFSLTGPTATSPPHYWAFAGTSKSTFPPLHPIISPHHQPTPPSTRETHSISFPCSIHTTWTRYLDSRGDITTPDQGTTYLLHNGDCLETGTMINPDTGTWQSYQELWTSPPANDVDDQQDRTNDLEQLPTIRDESPPTQHQPTRSELKVKVKATVALLHRPPPPQLSTESGSGSEVKGMIVRIGNYCQGIIEMPPSTSSSSSSNVESGVCHQQSTAQAGSVRVERWRFNSKTDSILSGIGIGIGTGGVMEEEGKKTGAEGGEWMRDERSNYKEDKAEGIWMPCLWVCEGKKRIGDSTEKEGFAATWTVVEVEGW
ncbi:hypothetical protein GJ744_005413 [Endocarpon pusillum]|uniref:Protein HRI1 n=1 Tax=Endocarpon pusillum TaxID=364733 RepID=A0A8H7A4V4_9EURO|nr:hypothetical protein GJ744_005413 [Endocarpon pusillum]